MNETGLMETEIRHDKIMARKIVCGRLKKVEEMSDSDVASRRRITFSAPLKASDLSQFNQLAVRALNRSSIPLLAEMRLFCEDGTGMPDEPPFLFSGGREGIAPGQQRELAFPREAFGFYGTERGWDNLSRLEVVFMKGKTDEGHETMDVALGPLYGEGRLMPKGPRLTEEGLYLQLKEGVTDPLSTVIRKIPTAWLIPPPHPYPVEKADEILAGYIMGQKLSFPLPWDFSPDGAHEWTHFLNRHHFLRQVLYAFIETGDDRYGKFIETIVSDWIVKNPVPIGSNGGAGPSWETLTAAWRMREWLRIGKVLWRTPFFAGEAKNRMLRSIWEHCRHLMDHRGHPNNWIILESGALALAGMELRQFREASLWRNEGIARLKEEIGRQFLPDGVHFECSPLYHALCLHILLEIRQTAAAMKMRLPKEFKEPLKRAAGYLKAICRPDFTWPSLNDSGEAAGNYSGVMRLAGEIFGRDDYIWIGTKGKEGRPPKRLRHTFPSAGIAVMRSGYSRDSHFLLFRAGPPGMTHIHEDVLSLDVSISGAPCLVDPGVTAYAPGAMTDYYRSSVAHNMILIDGKGPPRSELPYQRRIAHAGDALSSLARGNRWTVSGICGDYRGKDGSAITVKRTVAFVNRAYWEIFDAVTGTGNHTVTVCWQFFPGRVTYNPETRTARCENDSGACFSLVLLSDRHDWEVVHSQGALNPPEGWVSVDGHDVPADHLRYFVTTTLPASLTWKICPVPAFLTASATII